MKVKYDVASRTLFIDLNPGKKGWYHETYEGLKSCDMLTISRSSDEDIAYIAMYELADEVILSEIPERIRSIVRKVLDERGWSYREF